jgi:hypothetical protein
MSADTPVDKPTTCHERHARIVEELSEFCGGRVRKVAEIATAPGAALIDSAK